MLQDWKPISSDQKWSDFQPVPDQRKSPEESKSNRGIKWRLEIILGTNSGWNLGVTLLF